MSDEGLFIVRWNDEKVWRGAKAAVFFYLVALLVSAPPYFLAGIIWAGLHGCR